MPTADLEKHVFQARSLPLVSVTVFGDRAEVKRNMKASLKSGINEIIIEVDAFAFCKGFSFMC